MIGRRILAAGALVAAAFGGSSALAVCQSGVSFCDPTTDDARRCDTWYRDGNATDGSKYDDDGDGASWDNGPAQNVGDPTKIQIVNEGGHYVVRNQYGYVEVAGGQDYRRPDGNPLGARGGYVQGEIDAGMGTPDVDFLAATFANSDGPPAANPTSPGPTNLGYAEKDACVNVGNSRVVDLMDCTKPPKVGQANCR